MALGELIITSGAVLTYTTAGGYTIFLNAHIATGAALISGGYLQGRHHYNDYVLE